MGSRFWDWDSELGTRTTPEPLSSTFSECAGIVYVTSRFWDWDSELGTRTTPEPLSSTSTRTLFVFARELERKSKSAQAAAGCGLRLRLRDGRWKKIGGSVDTVWKSYDS